MGYQVHFKIIRWALRVSGCIPTLFPTQDRNIPLIKNRFPLIFAEFGDFLAKMLSFNAGYWLKIYTQEQKYTIRQKNMRR
jgi:hypothetical protein